MIENEVGNVNNTFNRILLEGNTYSVILAYCSSDDFDSIQQVKENISIELKPGFLQQNPDFFPLPDFV